MYEMERQMAEQEKIDIAKKAKEEGVREAQSATANAHAGYTAESGSSPATEPSKINLSDDQKRVADRMGVSYADYQQQLQHTRRAPRTKTEYK